MKTVLFIIIGVAVFYAIMFIGVLLYAGCMQYFGEGFEDSLAGKIAPILYYAVMLVVGWVFGGDVIGITMAILYVFRILNLSGFYRKTSNIKRGI